jgi:Fuc2NAc and GlcNAc transferase
MSLWIAGGVAFAVSLIATRAAFPLLEKCGLIDRPNARSSHTRPTLRGGGAVAVLLVLGAMGLEWGLGEDAAVPASLRLVLLVAGGAIAGVSLIDDARGVSARLRLAVQILAAVVAVVIVGWVERLDVGGWGMAGGLVGAFLTVILIVWSTNLYNFMDGIDGLAAVQAVTGAGTLALLALLGGDQGRAIAPILLASAFAGFLVWNRPPARVFMGDVGSAFLGFAFAVIVIEGNRAGVWPIWIFPIVLAFFLTDATATLLRRLARGERVTQAHRSHAYQKLARRHGSHAPITWGLAVHNVVWCAPLAVVTVFFPGYAALAAVAAILPSVLVFVSVRRSDES